MTGKYIPLPDCPHVTLMKEAAYNEYRVTYKGLWPERIEAMAYYTDDREDAIGTARIMERDRELQVFHSDIKDRRHWPERFNPTKE